MRFVARFLLGAAIVYALIHVLWWPLQPVFTRLLAAVAQPLLRLIDDPPLITALAAQRESIQFFTFLTGAASPMAGWSTKNLAVFMLAPLALLLAVPHAQAAAKLRLVVPLLTLSFLFCIGIAVVQIELTAEAHATTRLGITLHGSAEKVWLERTNGALHVVGMLAFPAFVFLAAYVYFLWIPRTDRASGPGLRTIALATSPLVALLALVLLAPGAPDSDPLTHDRGWARLVHLNPKFATGRVNLGLHYERIGKVERAIEEYRSALEVDPQLVPALYNLGNALRATGAWVEAATRYEEALRHEPEHAYAHRNLGLTLERLGRPCEAQQQLQQSAALDPVFAAEPELRRRLLDLAARCGSGP